MNFFYSFSVAVTSYAASKHQNTYSYGDSNCNSNRRRFTFTINELLACHKRISISSISHRTITALRCACLPTRVIISSSLFALIAVIFDALCNRAFCEGEVVARTICVVYVEFAGRIFEFVACRTDSKC